MTLWMRPWSTASPTTVEREAFCDAVGHVDSRGFAPFGYDVTFIDDEAGWYRLFL